VRHTGLRNVVLVVRRGQCKSVGFLVSLSRETLSFRETRSVVNRGFGGKDLRVWLSAQLAGWGIVCV